jgi:hypothetical protein
VHDRCDEVKPLANGKGFNPAPDYNGAGNQGELRPVLKARGNRPLLRREPRVQFAMPEIAPTYSSPCNRTTNSSRPSSCNSTLASRCALYLLVPLSLSPSSSLDRCPLLDFGPIHGYNIVVFDRACPSCCRA